MKKEELPQDKKIIKGEDNTLKKVLYVTDDSGNYESAQSDGWEAENYALTQAWEDIDEHIAETREKVKNGEVSPIAYFMLKNLMDLPILASYVGKWKWVVKRHLKPSVFKKLDQKTLERYASVFNITVDELTKFPAA